MSWRSFHVRTQRSTIFFLTAMVSLILWIYYSVCMYLASLLVELNLGCFDFSLLSVMLQWTSWCMPHSCVHIQVFLCSIYQETELVCNRICVFLALRIAIVPQGAVSIYTLHQKLRMPVSYTHFSNIELFLT